MRKWVWRDELSEKVSVSDVAPSSQQQQQPTSSSKPSNITKSDYKSFVDDTKRKQLSVVHEFMSEWSFELSIKLVSHIIEAAYIQEEHSAGALSHTLDLVDFIVYLVGRHRVCCLYITATACWASVSGWQKKERRANYPGTQRQGLQHFFSGDRVLGTWQRGHQAIAISACSHSHPLHPT